MIADSGGRLFNSLSCFATNGWRMGNAAMARMLHIRPTCLPVIMLFLTYRCNLRCRMCGVCDLESPMDPAIFEGELTLDECKAVVDSAVKLRTSLLIMSGGEVFLRPDELFAVARYAHDRHISIHICTNGLLIDDYMARQCGECNIDTVSISIESPVKEIHEKLRGPNTYDKAIEAISNLRQYAPNVQVGINCTLTRYNFRDVKDMVPFAEKLGVHQLKLAPIHTNLLHRRKDVEHYSDMIFMAEDLGDLDKEVAALMAAASKTGLLTSSPLFLSRISSLYRGRPTFRCHAGYATCIITPKGRVSPCSDTDEGVSLREMPLEKIWASTEFHELRKKVHTCQCSCWDTANAEISLRLRPTSLIRNIAQNWRDFTFYFHDDNG